MTKETILIIGGCRRITRHYFLFLLGLYFIIFLPHTALAISNYGLPGVEPTIPYSVRPVIESIEPALLPTHQTPDQWDKLKISSFYFVLEILALYPEEDLYFLARDAESFYDMARALLQNSPADLARLHNINVSTDIREDENLMEYMKQEGLTAENLALRRAIFVETGYKGSVPTKIIDSMLANLQHRISGHLVQSSSYRYPSSRVFLAKYLAHNFRGDPAPDTDAHHVKLFENLPHYTTAAERLKWIEDSEGHKSWQPMTRAPAPEERQQSIGLMGDIRAFALDGDTLKLLQKILGAMKTIATAARNGKSPNNSPIRQAVGYLESIGIAHEFLSDLREAQVRGSIDDSEGSRRNFWAHIPEHLIPELGYPDFSRGFDFRDHIEALYWIEHKYNPPFVDKARAYLDRLSHRAPESMATILDAIDLRNISLLVEVLSLESFQLAFANHKLKPNQSLGEFFQRNLSLLREIANHTIETIPRGIPLRILRAVVLTLETFANGHSETSGLKSYLREHVDASDPEALIPSLLATDDPNELSEKIGLLTFRLNNLKRQEPSDAQRVFRRPEVLAVTLKTLALEDTKFQGDSIWLIEEILREVEWNIADSVLSNIFTSLFRTTRNEDYKVYEAARKFLLTHFARWIPKYSDEMADLLLRIPSSLLMPVFQSSPQTARDFIRSQPFFLGSDPQLVTWVLSNDANPAPVHIKNILQSLAKNEGAVPSEILLSLLRRRTYEDHSLEQVVEAIEQRAQTLQQQRIEPGPANCASDLSN